MDVIHVSISLVLKRSSHELLGKGKESLSKVCSFVNSLLPCVL